MDILIVEDNRHMRRMLLQIVHDAFPAAQLAEAADGRGALEQCALAAPRVILMDIDLPDANGLDLTARIKAQQPDTAVIIVSNHSRSQYRSHAAASGAHSFINKDVLHEHLIQVMGKILGGDAGQPAPAAVPSPSL